jgi:hypothetical protein
MMKHIFLLGSLLSIGISTSSAIQVSIAKGTGAGITVLDSAGTAQPTFRIQVGTFDAAPNIDLTGFNSFGSTTSASNLITGAFTVSEFGTTAPAAEKFNNKSIYIVITNNDGTQRGILARGSAASNDWLFPADVTPGLAPTESLDTNNATRVTAPVGTLVDNASGVDNLRLAPIAAIPEPSSLVLGLASLIGLVSRRRR